LASIASLFGVLTKLAISRTREFVADAGAVQLTKNPDALISALRKIAGHEEIAGLPAALQAMMISSRLGGLWSTHPTVERRIAALETFAGARSAEPERKEGMPLPRRGRPIGVQSALLQPSTFGRRKRQTASSAMGS
jgi:heat shock protein HtpX